ncbi:malonyl-ACP O-methyltransferase BioC [Campylobacter sp. CNRCH_2013_0671h]|uniref:malonyl-ACP O-methyltransferase BioC n=1 Tax=Campylobacter sp. CNRCH_2013_0671h TaxID=2911599 RepID=UPI0021E66777|nr:malonyl-ACP O-methyltransferase BioC [Campylobacter sp. CNRCH_2013_0671h]MCV3548783.1 malonyl-ACP O-methyltransferase BioC [Campylobacter sp. CNRCH_2013_0671h]
MQTFIRAKDTYSANTPVQKDMVKELCKMLSENDLSDFKAVFEFGCGVGVFSKALQECIKFKHYFLNDIYPFENPCKFDEFGVFDMNELKNHHFYTKKFDLIASNACMQWLKIDELLENFANMLNKNGILLFSTFGEKNFTQIKQSTNLSLEYLTLEQIRQKLSKNFKIIKAKEELKELKFDDTLELFRHLKLSGVNALSEKFFIGKAFLKNYEKEFQNTLTYHPLFFLVRKL